MESIFRFVFISVLHICAVFRKQIVDLWWGRGQDLWNRILCNYFHFCCTRVCCYSEADSQAAVSTRGEESKDDMWDRFSGFIFISVVHIRGVFSSLFSQVVKFCYVQKEG